VLLPYINLVFRPFFSSTVAMPFEGQVRDTDCGPAPDERQPLLSGSKIAPEDASLNNASGEKKGADLRIVLPAIMTCAFLAAFDVTVVAAIYSVMCVPYRSN
jgi:hypothetical protein